MVSHFKSASDDITSTDVIKVSLSFQIIGVALKVETIPLDVTVSIYKQGERPVEVARHRERCTDSDSDVCQEFLSMAG